MQIRDCKAEDLKYIKDIKNYYIENTDFSLAYHKISDNNIVDWYNLLRDKYPIIVAEENNEIIGFSSLSSFRSIDGYYKTCELSIYLSKDFVGKGIGNILIQNIILKAREYNFHAIVSAITEINSRSIAFHEKFGFRKSGVFSQVGYKNNKYLDVVFMTKVLD